MTVSELLDAYVRVGVEVYLDSCDVVRVRAVNGTPAAAGKSLVAAVVRKLRHVGREAVRARLLAERAEAAERVAIDGNRYIECANVKRIVQPKACESSHAEKPDKTTLDEDE